MFVSAIKITWKKAARTLRFRSAILMLYIDIHALLGLLLLLVHGNAMEAHSYVLLCSSSDYVGRYPVGLPPQPLCLHQEGHQLPRRVQHCWVSF